MNRPDVLVSYAQNHEDVVLARILRPWKRFGHWIDIGAGHPTFDSVTRLFHDFGWTGINVEPLSEEFELLQKHRPDDINLKCAIGREPGHATLFEGPPESRGTSTMVRENAAVGSIFKETLVEVRTLDSLIDSLLWPVDFIKIDVEGMENEIICSSNWSRIKAEVLVIEATRPNSIAPMHRDWEQALTDAGYTFRLFDGLNRYFSRETHVELTDEDAISLWFPATAQDKFVSFDTLDARTKCAALQLEILEGQRKNIDLDIYARSLETSIALLRGQLEDVSSYVSGLERTREQLEKALADAEASRIESASNLEFLRRHVESLTSTIESQNKLRMD